MNDTIEYVSQNSLFEYLKLLYSYIKTKMDSSTPSEVNIDYHLIADGSTLDGDWNLVTSNIDENLYLIIPKE